MVSALPSEFCVGGVQESVALPVAVSVTEIVKEVNEAVALPSETVTVMPLYVPTSALVGAPEMRPVEVLKAAQEGKFVTANVSASPFGSDAEG